MNFRTDMAVERRDIYRKAKNLEEIPGIEFESQEISPKIKVTRVKVTTEDGEKALGKKIGNYVTVDINKINISTDEELEQISNVFTEELKKVINEHVQKQDEVLIVGLGNLYSTPDALGSKVVKNIEVTRHIKKYLPQYIDENERAISAVSPGVLGTTGIETAEIIKGIVQNVKPKMLIAIDSLASKSLERISSSIQISDTGIVPGGGVGNTREELTKESIGIPVIAVGVPTVVNLKTIMDEGINEFIGDLQDKAQSNEYLNGLKEKGEFNISDDENHPYNNMIVTPKEIDDLVENMTNVLARGINMSL
ncbi:MAG: GPR endopeptidase [Candidatus Scatovivens sp.]